MSVLIEGRYGLLKCFLWFGYCSVSRLMFYGSVWF